MSEQISDFKTWIQEFADVRFLVSEINKHFSGNPALMEVLVGLPAEALAAFGGKTRQITEPGWHKFASLILTLSDNEKMWVEVRTTERIPCARCGLRNEDLQEVENPLCSRCVSALESWVNCGGVLESLPPKKKGNNS
jgi:hypothetical protein